MKPRLIILCFVLLLASNVYAKPRLNSCARIKSQHDAWVGARVDALVTAARAAYEDLQTLKTYHRVLVGITSTLRTCKLSEDHNFLSRYREFVDYIEVASLDRRPNHQLGFNVPDRHYFAETSHYVQIPDFLLDPAFLKSASRHETLDQAKAYLRLLNSTRKPSEQLIYFSYESRHLGTPDNADSFRRLLIVVPGDANSRTPEKWVQFGITDPGERLRVRNLSVVSVLMGDDGTFNAYFKDYFRTFRRDGSITVKGRWELGHGDDNCVQCHKSGVLPIFPEAGSVRPDEQPAVEAVNQRFRGYGQARFDKYLDRSKFGPGLSFASLESRAQRFGRSFNKTNIARAMTCQSCHKSEYMGALNWPMDRVLISSYIEGGRMPLGHNLKTAERLELHSKLIQEYFSTDNSNPGILKSWLLGNGLFSSQ